MRANGLCRRGRSTLGDQTLPSMPLGAACDGLLPLVDPPCWTCVDWSKEQSLQRAWEGSKESSSNRQHPFPSPSHWSFFESCCFQCGTGSGSIFLRHCSFFFFIHCSLSGTSLLIPLVPHVSLNSLLVCLLSVLDLSLCLLHVVILSPLIFQPRPSLVEL